MAFQIPSHLPRRAQTQDPSTVILNKIAEEPRSSFKAEKAREWLKELDDAILLTKSQIHEKIISSRVDFDEQFSMASSVQRRAKDITSQVEELVHAVNDPHSGLLPNLFETLKAHSQLAQEALNITTAHEALSFLHACNEDYDSISQLVSEGLLTDAVVQCEALKQMLDNAPRVLEGTTKFAGLKKSARVLNASIHEQLSIAYAQSVVVDVLSSEGITLTVDENVLFTNAKSLISLSTLLSSLSPNALDAHLVLLQKEIVSHFINTIITVPFPYTAEVIEPQDGIQRLVISPNPDRPAGPSRVLETLQTLLRFFDTHLFPALPNLSSTFNSASSPLATFRKSLYKPIIHKLLDRLLRPSLPSLLENVPAFLEVLSESIKFEEEVERLRIGESQFEIRNWAHGVETWYERQRVESHLDYARRIFDRPTEASIRVKVERADEEVSLEDRKEASWDFEDGESGWGFDDEEGTAEDVQTAPEPILPPPPTLSEDDPDGWNWDDEDDIKLNESEPLKDRPPETKAVILDKPKTLKAATRLEKLAAKAKGTGSASERQKSQSPISTPPSTSTSVSWVQPARTPSPPVGNPQKSTSKPRAENETYRVSSRAIAIRQLVEHIVREAEALRRTDVFSGVLWGGTAHEMRSAKDKGNLLFQAAYAVCDLTRALFPIVHERQKVAGENTSIDLMQWSCDFRFLRSELYKLVQGLHLESEGLDEDTQKQSWDETLLGLETYSEKCLEDALEQGIATVETLLGQTFGFRDISDDRRMREVEGAMRSVVSTIKGMAGGWKGILPHMDYFTTIGVVIDAVLLKVIHDIIALPDITEMESERLASVCKMLEPLQELFIAADGQTRAGVYVASWFKYSYLSELLAASIADISYLFEEGMLVDYEVGEIVKLLKALFADTTLRETTIRRIEQGHPTLH